VEEVGDVAAAEEAFEDIEAQEPAEDGEPCVVPSTCVSFKYYGVLYDGCTTIGTGDHRIISDAWCATATDDGGNFVVDSSNFEYCDKACANSPTGASLVLIGVESEGVRAEKSSMPPFLLIAAAALVAVVAAVAAAGWKRRSQGFAEEPGICQQGMRNVPIHARSFNGGPMAQL
jgi:hypothetical protein